MLLFRLLDVGRSFFLSLLMSIAGFMFSDPETSCNLLGFRLIEMKSRQLSGTLR